MTAEALQGPCGRLDRGRCRSSSRLSVVTPEFCLNFMVCEGEEKSPLHGDASRLVLSEARTVKQRFKTCKSCSSSLSEPWASWPPHLNCHP